MLWFIGYSREEFLPNIAEIEIKNVSLIEFCNIHRIPNLPFFTPTATHQSELLLSVLSFESFKAYVMRGKLLFKHASQPMTLTHELNLEPLTRDKGTPGSV